jgi:hypothetical protein
MKASKAIVATLGCVTLLVVGFFLGAVQEKSGFAVKANPIKFSQVPYISNSVDLNFVFSNLPANIRQQETWVTSQSTRILNVYILQSNTSYSFTLAELINPSQETLSLFDLPRRERFLVKKQLNDPLSNLEISSGPVFIMRSTDDVFYPLSIEDLERSDEVNSWIQRINEAVVASEWLPKYSVITSN